MSSTTPPDGGAPCIGCGAPLPPEVLHISFTSPDGRLFTQLCDACRTPEAVARLDQVGEAGTVPCENCGKALTPEELLDALGTNLCWACRTADPDQYGERRTEGDAVEQQRVKLRVGERITVKRDGTEESGVVRTVDPSHYTMQTDDGRMLRYELRFKQRRAKLAGMRCTLCGRVLSPDEELDVTFLRAGEHGTPVCSECRTKS